MEDQTIFTIRPHRGGWQCLEAPGVEPYFVGKDAKRSAIEYAQGRTAHRIGEIRVINAAGALQVTIAFDERARRI